MQFTEKDLTKLIQDLEVEFSDHFAKAELEAAQTTPLVKAEDEKPAEEKADKPEAKEESKEESKEAPKAESEAKPQDEAAPAAPAQEAAPAQAPEAAANAIYDAEDMAHLEKMYMSMSKEEQMIHHDVLRKCMDASQAAPAPEAAQAAPAEMDKCGDMSMSKAENTTAVEETQTVEIKAEDVKTNPELELAKSEAAAAQAKAETLQKSLDTIQEFLTKLVKKAPQGKAITSMEQIAKSETGSQEGEQTLSKSEISAILGKKAADPSLNKSDREAINAFYLNGANINTISHLLKN